MDKKIKKIDIGDVLKFSFSWISNPEALKYAAIFAIINLAIFLIATAASGPQESDILSSMTTTEEPLTEGLSLPSTLGMGVLFGMLLLALILLFIGWLIGEFFAAKFTLIALKSKNIKTGAFDFSKLIRYVILGILGELCAIFCWFNKKFLLVCIPALLGIILLFVSVVIQDETIKSIAPIIALLLIVIFSIPYVIILTYNRIRLSMARVIFLSREDGLMDSLRRSWELTHRRVLEIFVVYLICGIVLSIPIIAIKGIALALSLVFSSFAGDFVETLFFPIEPLLVTFMLVGIFSGLITKQEAEKEYRKRRNFRAQSIST